MITIFVLCMTVIKEYLLDIFLNILVFVSAMGLIVLFAKGLNLYYDYLEENGLLY